MDQMWSENENGLCLLGTTTPGELIELPDVAPDWVRHPFADIRFAAYLALRDPVCTKIRAWREFGSANHGLAASKWALLRNARSVWYTIPPSVERNRMWLRHASEAAFVANFGAFLRNRSTATIGEVFQRSGLLSYPQWWMGLDESVAQLRIEAECASDESGTLIARQDQEVLRIRETRYGTQTRIVEALASKWMHMHLVDEVAMPQWWSRLRPDWGL